MTVRVLAPFDCEVVALSDVPDPVFSQGMVGPGLAVTPVSDDAQDALAPVAGRLTKVMAHACVITTTGPDGVHDGPSVLVHLGIDTVKRTVPCAEILTSEGSPVDAGSPLWQWTPGDLAREGFSVLTPIVALDIDEGALGQLPPTGTRVNAGELLFTIDA